MQPTTRARRRRAAVLTLLSLLLVTPAQAQRAPPRARATATGEAVWPPSPALAPVGGRVLRRFAPPATPYGRGHRGVDLAAQPGEAVRATLAGEVTFAGAVAGVVWVTVAHPGGLETTYGGLVPAVAPGDRVAVGTTLGRATGRGRVDWGARRAGAYVDPLGLLAGWVVRLVPVRDRE